MSIRRITLPITIIASLLVALTLTLMLTLVLIPRISDDEDCVPTTARDCGCVSDAVDSDTPSSAEQLSRAQRSYREESFEHDGVSSTYRVFSYGIDPSLPVGVVIRLHGDGAYEYEHSDAHASCLAAVAAAHNMLLVQPVTPSRDETWWTDLSTNTTWLTAFYEDRITDLEGVDPNLTWWMGYSGGAEMISYGLLPLAGDTITGGAIMVGGGGAPARPGHTVPIDRVPGLPLHWATGQRDTGADPREPFDALKAARKGSAFYLAQGFESVTTDFSRNDDHYSIDEIDVLDSTLDATKAPSSRPGK